MRLARHEHRAAAGAVDRVGRRDGGQRRLAEADVAAVMAAARPERRARVPDPVGRRRRTGSGCTPPRRRARAPATSGSRNPGSTTMSLLSSSTASRPALDRGLDAGVDAAREAGVPAQPDHDGVGKRGLDGLGAAVASSRCRRRSPRAAGRRPRPARRDTRSVSSLPFQERTTTATGSSTAVSAIGAMIIDPYAPVRRMNSEIQPLPIQPPPPAGEDSHAPAVLRSSALQIGGPRRSRSRSRPRARSSSRASSASTTTAASPSSPSSS